MVELKSIPDEDLARQAQAGSMPAFEKLVSRFERRIYAFVANVCHNATDASEITQDTFVRAFQGLAGFDSRRPFAAWLFTIARRKCIDHHRAKRFPVRETAPDATDVDDPFELLAQQEDRQNLWEVARRLLPEAQFQALWLRYAEEMDVAQVAHVLRKTRTHIKVLLFRARQALGSELERREQGAEPVHKPGPAMPERVFQPKPCYGGQVHETPEHLSLVAAVGTGHL